jgi:transcriptional regulator with XRE-family HTH domain
VPKTAKVISNMYLKTDEEHSGSDETLGGRIVYARELQDLTTAQLARRIGVKTETLQGWESDRSEPRSNRLLTLAGMLNVSPTWLLTGAGESPIDALNETEMMHLRATIDRMHQQVLTVAEELEQLKSRLESYQSNEV